jgi:hypothetical protein
VVGIFTGLPRPHSLNLVGDLPLRGLLAGQRVNTRHGMAHARVNLLLLYEWLLSTICSSSFQIYDSRHFDVLVQTGNEFHIPMIVIRNTHAQHGAIHRRTVWGVQKR